jgi:hypothetical protein
MLGLTADIADELLQIKDSERNSLTDDLKLKIISLAELAASPELDQPEPEVAPAPIVPEPLAPAPVVPEPEEPAAPELPEVEVPVIPEPEPEPEIVEPVISEPEIAEPEPEVPEVAEPKAPEAVAIPDFDIAETVEWVDDEATAEDESTEAPIEPEIPQAPKVEPAPAPAKLLIDPKELQRAFSINDAFLFRREIFGGSKQEFDRALNHIATLSDYHQLQHFLVETLNLNLNKAPGKEFYQLLVGFFK